MINDQISFGCIRVRVRFLIDEACTGVMEMIPPGNLFLPGFATVNFSAPSSVYPGTKLSATLTLVATSLPKIVPTIDLLFEPQEHDIFVGPTLSFAWRIVSTGTVNSPTLGRFLIVGGRGTLGQGIGAEVEQCAGACVEPTPTPSPTDPPCEECEE